jgi:hypothetical protein
MNKPRRFDDDEQDLHGTQGPSHQAGGPPEHPGIGQNYQDQGAPMYPGEAAHEEPDQRPPEGGYDPRHATWTTAQATDPAADVYGQDSGRAFGPPEDVVDAHVVAPAAPPKRRKGPLLAFGAVFGVIVIAVGIAMFRVLAGGSGQVSQDMAMAPPPMMPAPPPMMPAPATPAPIDPAVPPAAPAAPSVQAATAEALAQTAAPSALAAPALPAVPAVPGLTTPPSTTATTTSTATAAGSVSASPVQSKEVQALQKTVDELKTRVDTMSKDIAAIRDQRARQVSQTGIQKADEARAQAKAERRPQSSSQTARRGTQPGQSATTAGAATGVGPGATAAGATAMVVSTAAAAPPPQDPMQGLNLRAVYPPSGADMQAWVMEGEVLRVVSRGSEIAGTRVLDVLPDRVVTDRGVIR